MHGEGTHARVKDNTDHDPSMVVEYGGGAVVNSTAENV